MASLSCRARLSVSSSSSSAGFEAGLAQRLGDDVVDLLQLELAGRQVHGDR